MDKVREYNRVAEALVRYVETNTTDQAEGVLTVPFQHYTNPVTKLADWRHIWMIPSAGAAICLLIFVLLWRDKPGKVEEEVEEARGFPVEPVAVTQGTVEATRSQG